MSTLGNRLLGDKRYLNRRLEWLVDFARRATFELLHEDRRIQPDEVMRRIKEKEDVQFEPLELHTLKFSRVFDTLRGYRRDGDIIEGYVAEARFRYHGSKLLWSAYPGHGLLFPHRGVASNATVGWRGIVPSKDLREFTEGMLLFEEPVREALRSFVPQVLAFNEAVEHRMMLAINGFY